MWNDQAFRKMREAYGDAVIDLARHDPRVLFVSADCGAHEREFFRKEHAGRLIEMGIAEANSACVAAALASEGFKPHLLNFAYLLARMYNQIGQTICVDAYPVRIAAYYAGVWGIGGRSHNCVIDLAFMRALPNLTIFSPADYWETATIVRQAETIDGPTYIRLAGVPTPVVFDAQPRFTPVRRMADGADCTIFCHGPAVAEALRARTHAGLDAAIVSVAQIKPLPVEAIVAEAARRPAVVVVEDHSRIGGLGEAIAAAVAEHCPRPIALLGVPDVFPWSVLGEEPEVYGRYGIGARDIAAAVERVSPCTNVFS
ncbi:MAG: transketolase family protein [Acidobacteria bacterium]|nr:transketolase family protein [Acidobacteriota bacterium]